MTKTDWTAEEVRVLAEKFNGFAGVVSNLKKPNEDNDFGRAATMLTAFANRIEADEMAVPAFYYRRDVDRGLLSIEVNEYNSWAKDNRPEDAYSPAFTRPLAHPSEGRSIAADESAVPVAWLCVTHDGSNSDAVVSEFACDTYKHTRTITPLFTHPPAQPAQLDCAVCGCVADANCLCVDLKPHAPTTAPAQEQPGWKWVPVEPTGTMIEAGCKAIACAPDLGGIVAKYTPEGYECWAAMLAASPTPPKEN